MGVVDGWSGGGVAWGIDGVCLLRRWSSKPWATPNGLIVKQSCHASEIGWTKEMKASHALW